MDGMQPQKRPPVYAVAIVLALLIAGSALAYKFSFGQSPRLPHTAIEIGKAGSAHAHISMLIFVGGTVVNFCEQRFMLRSQFVHFEDNNCTVIHKHATGVTLPVFFKTIGVELSETCMKLPLPDGQHCNDSVNHLRVVVNGAEVSIPDLSYYELRNNDHVLVNYGPEEGGMLRFKYNQVPPVPLDINEASSTASQ